MNQQEFISRIAPTAVEDMHKTRIPASLTIAQAILESGWGSSELAVNAKNLFGIKGTGPAGSYEKVSDEVVNGKKIQKASTFRKYNNWTESIRDHTDFLLKPRYSKVIGADWKTACQEVYDAKYATDPVYPKKLIEIIEQYKLYQYDVQRKEGAPINITDMLLTNKTARPGTKITPKGVVIHWTANEGKGANAVANRNYFNKPTTEASTQYIVDDTQIIRCLPENEMGYHVGAKTYKPDALKQLSSYPNNCTIGIEMCVNADGDFKAMYQNTLELAADILKRYGWGVDHLWRHFDITGKNCPAYFVGDDYARRFTGLTAAQAWAKFKDDVQKLLTGNPQKTQNTVDTCQISLKLDATGLLIDGVSYVPVRAITEAVGGTIGWDPVTQKVTVNGVEVAVRNEKGTSYAPARVLAEVLGKQVEWDGTTKTVLLKGVL